MKENVVKRVIEISRAEVYGPPALYFWLCRNCWACESTGGFTKEEAARAYAEAHTCKNLRVETEFVRIWEDEEDEQTDHR